MNVLIEVVKDLLHFVFVEWFGARAAVDSSSRLSREFAVVVPAPIVTPLHKTQPLLSSGRRITGQNSLETVGVAVPTAHLFLEPVAAFDSVIANIPYGSMLTVFQKQNRWYQVEYRGHSGWILKDTVTAGEIYPQFLLGKYYDAKNIETIKLRSIIHDEFYGGLLDIALEDVEYATYKLLRKGKFLPWSDVRPRVSGSWRALLRGALGVHIGIAPKADSVMEVVSDEAVGHVSYVESVFPDESIIVSEIGFPEEGMYSERTLPKEEWREFRPVFIAVA